MIEAELYNKIPKLERWEDILTSNVFGLLDLIDNKYLLEIISNAKNIHNDSISNRVKGKNIKDVELWRNFTSIGEPDIVVTLDDNTFFIIEVKYFSHEHNSKKDEDNNTEVDNYEEQGQLDKYFNIKIDNYNKNDFIIYLTQDYQSLKVIQENKENSSNNIIDNVYHLHWNDFNEFLIKIENIEGIEKKIIDKIIEYLNFKGFVYWEGFKYKKEYKIKITKRGFYDRK